MSDLDTLPPIELDLQIALRVMGWADARFEMTTGYGECRVCMSASSRLGIFAPSRSMDHAWLAVEAMAAKQRNLVLNHTGAQYRCRFLTLAGPHIRDWAMDPNDGMTVWNASAPLAICRAALKAVR